MQLLDVVIAFALIMGALATIVTMIMEGLYRLLKIRKRDLVDLMRNLNHDLGWLDEFERWTFVRSVLTNPLHPAGPPTAPALKDELEKSGQRPETFVCDETIRSHLQSMRARNPGMFDSVSVEHVLRKFVQLPSVRANLLAQRAQVVADLDRLARRFQELRSASSARFKRSSQMWAVWVGLAFAIAVNVDAVRVFDALRANPQLAETIVAQQDALFEAKTEADTARDEREALEKKAEAQRKKVETLEAATPRDAAAIEAAKKAAAEAKEAAATLGSAEAIQTQIDRSVSLLGKLSEAGLPIGYAYFPYGKIGAPAEDGWSAFLAELARWLVRVILSGLLIGLGAPFWFDVAKRLAQVRKSFGGTASAEQHMAGKDPGSDHNQRRELVDQVAADALDDARVATRAG